VLERIWFNRFVGLDALRLNWNVAERTGCNRLSLTSAELPNLAARFAARRENHGGAVGCVAVGNAQAHAQHLQLPRACYRHVLRWSAVAVADLDAGSLRAVGSVQALPNDVYLAGSDAGELDVTTAEPELLSCSAVAVEHLDPGAIGRGSIRDVEALSSVEHAGYLYEGRRDSGKHVTRAGRVVTRPVSTV
jgi:hypothetical protein